MKIFEGKSPKERNQIIVLIAVGVLAMLAVAYNFSGLFFGKKKTTVSANVTPSPTASVRPDLQNPTMPNQSEVDFQYQTTKVFYNPGDFNAPDPGRNIFAFYEPPKPTPYSPTPVPPPPTPKPPTPTPTPPIFVAYATPQSVYAGSRGFRLEVNGDRFTPDTVILFNGTQLPTTYISPQGVTTEIPANLISFAGARNISVFTPDGKWSNTLTLNVQEPPKPPLEYIGMIARKRSNNDTAYFEEQGKKTPIGARLNDIVSGRFRLKSISADEVIFEDVNLGFSHKLALKRPVPGQPDTGGNPRVNNNFVLPNNPVDGDIPGIPSNIPRYVPPPQTPDPDNDKDDDGDGDGDNR